MLSEDTEAEGGTGPHRAPGRAGTVFCSGFGGPGITLLAGSVKLGRGKTSQFRVQSSPVSSALVMVSLSLTCAKPGSCQDEPRDGPEVLSGTQRKSNDNNEAAEHLGSLAWQH